MNGPVQAPAWHLFEMAFATPAELVVAPLQIYCIWMTAPASTHQAPVKATGAGGCRGSMKL